MGPYDTRNMELHEKQGVAYLTFPAFSAVPFVRHAFSTRVGGVSCGEFSSMNLSFHRGDPDETVLTNYHRFCDAAGFSFDSLVASAQDHHTEIRRVTKRECGIGIWRPRDQESVDGLLTDEPGVTLVTYYADCVPLYFWILSIGPSALRMPVGAGRSRGWASRWWRRWRISLAAGRRNCSPLSAPPSVPAATKWTNRWRMHSPRGRIGNRNAFCGIAATENICSTCGKQTAVHCCALAF